MKRCPSCRYFYEDSLTACPGCRVALEVFSFGDDSANGGTAPGELGNEPDSDSTYVFERRTGLHYTINGSIADSNTQQYYQSGFTKFIRSMFGGEPYQLGHTTFVTILRVEEHVRSGFPEQARDVVLYGDTRNMFVTGDDVTIEATRRGDRLVARNIYSHSIERNVRSSPNISAATIRIFTAVVLYLIITLIRLIVNADYYSLGREISYSVGGFFNSLLTKASSLLPVIFLIIGGILLISRMFRRR